jgi:hypothetical protein
MAPALPVDERRLRQIPVSWAALRQAAACQYLCISWRRDRSARCCASLFRGGSGCGRKASSPARGEMRGRANVGTEGPSEQAVGLGQRASGREPNSGSGKRTRLGPPIAIAPRIVARISPVFTTAPLRRTKTLISPMSPLAIVLYVPAPQISPYGKAIASRELPQNEKVPKFSFVTLAAIGAAGRHDNTPDKSSA